MLTKDIICDIISFIYATQKLGAIAVLINFNLKPAYFVMLDKFPLLGSGKIDALKLKDMVMEKINNKEYK